MCDTAVLVEPERVLFAKNSDRDPNEGQVLEWHARAHHAPGSRVRCSWIDIPQVEVTSAVLISRPFWMWGAEIGANEHGVVIGNEAVFTRQPYAEEGLLGMDLLRLALERARTAEAALEVLVTLLETHGQGGGCGHEDRSFTYHNSFLVADTEGAFVLETAGLHWASERVTGGARSISNGLTIEAFARDHSDRVRAKATSCARRRARSEALASRASGAADMMRLLRDHGPDQGDAPRYSRFNGAMGAPCVHAGGLMANSQTTASWVAELVPGATHHWVTGTASPCASLFKPVAVTNPVELGPAPGDRAEDGSLWWRWERLARRVARDPQRLLPLYAAERDALEADWLARPPEPSKAFAEAERRLAAWEARVAAAAADDQRPVWARRYWARRDERAGLSLA